MLISLLLFYGVASLRFHLKKHSQIIDQVHDIEQVQYQVVMQFGSQKQELELIIDTGSSDLWVASSKSNDFYHSVKQFNCQSSNTCSKTDQRLYITYDDGPISGILAWDQVWLHNIQFNQSFLLVDQASGNMVSCGGILGLGFKGIASNKNPSILESLYEQKLISKKYFSLYLKDEGEYGSVIVFGGVAQEYIKKGEQLMYVPLLRDDIYSIQIEGVSINDQLFSINEAVVDSGTSCLTFPADTMDDILNVFSNKGVKCSYRVENYAPDYCTVHCIVKATTEQTIINIMPTISIQINSTLKFSLYPQDYIYSCTIIDGSQSRCNTKLERSQQDNILLLGDAFLHSYYTVFDQSDKTLGFAHSINNKGLSIKIKQNLHKQSNYLEMHYIILCIFIFLI